MPMVLGTAGLTDEEFLSAFRSCALDPSRFRHGDHLRLAWLHVHREPLEEALAQVRAGIQAFAAHHGVSQKYHETITAAWVRLIATHREPSFESFLQQNDAKLSGDLLHRFWTPEVLASDEAKSHWVPPNRLPLP